MHCVVLLIVPYNQQANAVEVTWEDQKRINSFGRLHNRKVELLSHVKAQEVRTDKLMDSLIRFFNSLSKVKTCNNRIFERRFAACLCLTSSPIECMVFSCFLSPNNYIPLIYRNSSKILKTLGTKLCCPTTRL